MKGWWKSRTFYVHQKLMDSILKHNRNFMKIFRLFVLCGESISIGVATLGFSGFQHRECNENCVKIRAFYD